MEAASSNLEAGIMKGTGTPNLCPVFCTHTHWRSQILRTNACFMHAVYFASHGQDNGDLWGSTYEPSHKHGACAWACQ